MVTALAAQVEAGGDLAQLRGYRRQMVEHASQAIEAFRRSGPPWRLSQACMVRASAQADLAVSELEGRVAYIRGAIDDCERGLMALEEGEEFRYLIVADWHSMACTTLEAVRALIAAPEPRQMLDGILVVYADILGCSLQEEIRLQEEAKDCLLRAQVLEILVGVTSDATTRRRLLQDVSDLAQHAYVRYSHSSNVELALRAKGMLRETERRLAAEQTRSPAVMPLTQPVLSRVCATCGHENRPGSRFCAKCGTKLV